MTAPVIRQFVGTIPDKGQAQTAFDTNVDAFLDWQALQFAPDLVAFGVFADDTAAALVAANLPSLAGRNLDAVRVNAAANGVEFANVTAAGWALLDDANATAQRVTLGVPPIASPTFTGTPRAPTQTAGNNSTLLATTSFVTTANNLKANLASPTFTGTPRAPTQTAGNNSTLLATTSFVTTANNLKANLASPTFTGTPRAPTQTAGNNSTLLATTAYTRTAIPDVLNAAGSAPLYACRAWVNFNGIGAVAIRASGNVSSITDNGLGDYTVNFTTAMQDANYAMVQGAANISDVGDDDNDNKPVIAGFNIATAPTSSAARIYVKNGSASAVDSTRVTLSFFR